MTESRPPGSSRHADTRSSDRDGANPLQRPLPPGMGRRSAERETPGRATRSESATASPFRAPSSHGAAPASSRAAAEGRPAAREPLVAGAGARASEAGGGRRSRASESSRAARSGIPLMAPPPWQVEERQAEERLQAQERAVADQRGLPSWLGLVVLLAITGVGGIIDAVAGSGIKGAFSIGLIVGSLAAILLVRRSSMFPIVVAPPLVYFIASAVLLYVRSGGLSNRAAITDAAASWLVYGFPAIAGATAVVLIVAGVRLILHR